MVEVTGGGVTGGVTGGVFAATQHTLGVQESAAPELLLHACGGTSVSRGHERVIDEGNASKDQNSLLFNSGSHNIHIFFYRSIGTLVVSSVSVPVHDIAATLLL